MKGASALLWPGVPLALGSALLFGASTPFAKLFLGEAKGGMGPWMLAGLLYLGSGLGLGLVRLAQARRGASREAPLRRADLPWLAAVIAVGGIAGPVLLMIGLAATPAPTASLLLNLEGVFTLAIAWIVFQENVDARVGAGAAAIVFGAALLSWNGEGALAVSWPALAIAGAGLAWAVDNNLTRKLSSADALEIAMLKGLAAGAVNLLIAAAQAESWPEPMTAIAAGLVGFFGYGLSLTFFVLALRHLGAARTSAYFSTAPFIGAALGFAIFGGGPSLAFAAAALLMAFGLWMHLSERHAHEHIHEAMVHEHRHVHDTHHQHAHQPGDPSGEPHSHVHAHARMVHRHPHYPDLHHRHSHTH